MTVQLFRNSRKSQACRIS